MHVSLGGTLSITTNPLDLILHEMDVENGVNPDNEGDELYNIRCQGCTYKIRQGQDTIPVTGLFYYGWMDMNPNA